ncbi:MAG: AMP-binding protein [Alphaproteobacteria bacterium]|nr:AMP-binding protein [Alphaproteobacteria bacterium]
MTFDDPFPWGHDDRTIGRILTDRARETPEFVYARFETQAIDFRTLDRRVNRFANALIAAGIGPDDRVALMLPNHPDYFVAFLALLKLGVCQVPINVHLKGEGLAYLLGHAAPRAMIVDERYADAVLPVLAKQHPPLMIWRGAAQPVEGARNVGFDSLAQHAETSEPPFAPTPDKVVSIMYTSGTTGLPKGVMVTDRMLRVAARASCRLAEVKPGDVFHVWEPLYHIGGVEVMILGLMEPITLGMVERFSVSQFWSQVRQFGCTHIHFLGGVLAMLLKEPAGTRDRDHKVRVAWGGGCPVTIWRAFEERFGVQVRECYGMTECSSFTTQNLTGKLGSTGKVLPFFEVRIADDAGNALGANQRGEIWVREKFPGLITGGYFKNPEATAASKRDEWFLTGDLGYFDADGDYYYAGRKKDSIRRRGENIASYEVERMINEHPSVAESGIVGVGNELGDEDIKVFLRLKPGTTVEPLDFVKWCETRMAYFQVPRFVDFIDEFPKTPSERIRKDALSRDTARCFDLEKSGYKLQRRRA